MGRLPILELANIPFMGTATTTACRLSALAVCAGVGVALTGATGGTFLSAMAGSSMGGAAGNFFHQIVDDALSWFGGQKPHQLHTNCHRGHSSKSYIHRTPYPAIFHKVIA